MCFVHQASSLSLVVDSIPKWMGVGGGRQIDDLPRAPKSLGPALWNGETLHSLKKCCYVGKYFCKWKAGSYILLLATGMRFTYVQYPGVMGKSTISLIVHKTCECIINVLHEQIKVNSYVYYGVYFFMYLIKIHGFNHQSCVGTENQENTELKVPFVPWNVLMNRYGCH